MPVHGEWLNLPGAAVGPHFKYLPKRRYMDTSNWIRLKKGYDSLDASVNPPPVCWEKIGPDSVLPLLTKSPKLKKRTANSARAVSSARPASSARPPNSARAAISARPPSSARAAFSARPPSSARAAISARPPSSARAAFSARPPSSARAAFSARPPSSARAASSTRLPLSARAERAQRTLRRGEAIEKLPSEAAAERPISAWTVDEIRKTMYVPKFQKPPKPALTKKLSRMVLGITKEKDSDKKTVTPVKDVKRHNPYQEFYLGRNIESDPKMMCLQTLWKIAREFCYWFDSLGNGNPKVTDSFMVNLLASGCHLQEMVPINLQQMEDIVADLKPLIFKRPIDYGILPIDKSKPDLKQTSKRQRAFAYGRWYFPVKFWGKLDHEETQKVKEEQMIVDEESLLNHPCYRNYYLFLKDKGYRIPEILFKNSIQPTLIKKKK